MKNKSKSSKKWNNFCLRMKLLWIWFLKNLSLFIKVSIIIIAVLVATNTIGSENFIVQVLGFSELESINWSNIVGIENAIAIVISAIISALVLTKKTKRIAIEDIKSRDLKIALIKAHLYFNENGKLCKRVEELIDLDIDNDNKIGDTETIETKNENLIGGLVQAADELKTVLTVDLNQDEEKVIEKAELNEEIIENESIGLNDTNGMTITKEKKEKIKKENIFHRYYIKVSKFFNDSWHNLIVAIKSMKNPKLNDGMEEPKKKIKKNKPIKEEESKVENIEILEQIEIDSDLLEVPENSDSITDENKKSPEVSDKVISTQPKNLRISNKEKEIDDILKNLK